MFKIRNFGQRYQTDVPEQFLYGSILAFVVGTLLPYFTFLHWMLIISISIYIISRTQNVYFLTDNWLAIVIAIVQVIISQISFYIVLILLAVVAVVKISRG